MKKSRESGWDAKTDSPKNKTLLGNDKKSARLGRC